MAGMTRCSAAVLGLWLLMVAACALIELRTGFDLPTCLFKRATGWPCPTCGSTRAMVSLLHGHIGDAIALNPLMVLLVLLTPVTVLVSRGVSAPSNSRSPQSRMTATRWNIALALGLAALALNWAWVIHRGN